MKKLILISMLLLIVVLLNGNELMQKTLPNGMEIVVKENNLNESIGFYCFVKTGSVNEGQYLGAGISHYLEHIVSSGTTTFRTEDEYEKMGKEMGALVNAYTSHAVTAFYITVDKPYKDMALRNLSQQMQSCICDSFEVAREREVILKEIVMRSTPPRSRIHQRNNELIYPNSNKRYPVIGYTELYKTITRDELQDYYNARYAPNNMIFVAVGDFAAEEMLTQIEETFKDFTRKQLDPVYLPVQNPRSGSLEYIEEFDVEQPLVFSTTIISTADFGDIIALNTAMDILFGKRKSPIRYKLVEELKLVNYVYGYASGSDVDTEGTIVIGFEAKDIATDIKAHIPNKRINSEKFYSITSGLNDTFVNEYKFEQVNIDLGCKAPSINDDDFVVMQLIEMILSGSRGRLHQAVRGDNDLAYYAFPDYRYGENDGSFRLTSQTSIDKKNDLVRVMQNELEKLKTEEVRIEEITSAIEEREKMLRTILNENSMPYYITYYEAIGLGYDYIDRVSDIYKQVSQEDIQRVANKYFENVAIIISEPSEDVELMVE